jgi:hypothetical protein
MPGKGKGSRETRKKRAVIVLALRGLTVDSISQKTSMPISRVEKILATLGLEESQQVSQQQQTSQEARHEYDRT